MVTTREIDNVLTQSQSKNGSNVNKPMETNKNWVGSVLVAKETVVHDETAGVEELRNATEENEEGLMYRDESDDDDSLADVDPMTDDEEYISSKRSAAATRGKKQFVCQLWEQTGRQFRSL